MKFFKIFSRDNKLSEDNKKVLDQGLAKSKTGVVEKLARAIAGNWKYSLIGLRDQIQYETLREATLSTVTMADDKPLSLAENDMVAIKATMRLGFLPVKETAFAVLTPKATTTSGTGK